MAASSSILHELNEALSRGSQTSRDKAVLYAVDSLAVGRFTDDEIWVFGEVLGQLAEAIEVESRARLAERLAVMKCAPANVSEMLSLDDAISVAGPVLRHSDKLSTDALIQNVRTKSQQHLLAISQRRSLPAVITDELIKRGNREVLTSVASNEEAQFSPSGFLQLVQRAENDNILVQRLGVRRDIPRDLFQQLIAKASYEVRGKLERERPDLAYLVQASVSGVTDSLQSKFGPATKSYFEAKRSVAARKGRGELHETSIRNDAIDHRQEEVIAALAKVCELPASTVERSLRDSDLTMILAKACNFGWETTMALLFLGAERHRISAARLEHFRSDFEQLDRKTCVDVLDTYRSRRSELAGAIGSERLVKY